jgi:flagellar motor switch protein FliM
MVHSAVEEPETGPVAAHPVDHRHGHGRVVEIDFRRPSKFVREQVRRIEHAHQGYCRSVSSRLSAELRTEVELHMAGTDQLPYSTVMADIVPQAALVAVLECERLGTQIALVLELPLVLRLVERLLGGGALPTADDEERDGLTDVEVAVARRALTSLLEPLSATWADMADMPLELASVSVSPMTVQIVSASEPTLVVILDASIDGVTSPMRLCLPYRSVAGVLDRLEFGDFARPPHDPEDAASVRRALADVEVQLRAEVGAVELSLEDLLRLRVGDVIQLGRPADAGVIVYAGDVAAFHASPGRNRNRRAIRVTGRCL